MYLNRITLIGFISSDAEKKVSQAVRIARICEHLERDLASELHVPGTIDLSHAALPDGRKNFVGAQ
jgi:hypothetical protein